MFNMKTRLIITILTLSMLPILSQANTAIDEFQDEILGTHNELRARHDSPELQWDDTLAEYAHRHASQCEFRHTHGPYGENLAAGYPSAEAALTAWYDEQKHYSYSNPQFSTTTGHFTQLVWKSTRKIGCASVPCNGRNGTPGNYLVCEYSPGGNVVAPGYFSKNVTPAQPSQAKA
jgi:uncharacterized protein YkwD